MIKKLLAIFAVVTAILAISVPTLAAVTTMQLSSWAPEFSDGTMTGGTRTLTMTNVSEETLSDVSFSLDPAPCDCAVASYSASRGELDRLIWTVDRLEAGATANLTVRYQDATAVVAGNPAADITVAGRTATAISIALLLAALILARPGRFGIVTDRFRRSS